jgi:hypothetical protein
VGSHYKQPSWSASHTVAPATCLLRLAVGVDIWLSMRLAHLAHDVPFTCLYAAIMSCRCQHRSVNSMLQSSCFRVLTRSCFKSFACGRDLTHLEMEAKGSIVPRHSALILCLSFASCSILIWKSSMREPETNRVCMSVNPMSHPYRWAHLTVIVRFPSCVFSLILG